MGLLIEWLTGLSQVLGSRPGVFSCELKNFTDKAYLLVKVVTKAIPLMLSYFMEWHPLPLERLRVKLTPFREGLLLPVQFQQLLLDNPAWFCASD